MNDNTNTLPVANAQARSLLQTEIPLQSKAEHHLSRKTTNAMGENFALQSSLVDKASAEVTAQTIRVEAEDLKLRGYNIEKFSPKVGVSNHQLISRQGTDRRAGSAVGRFEGPPGRYDVTVGYYDESDGISRARVVVAGEATTFKFDRASKGVWVSPETFTDRVTHRGISLKRGDRFKLRAVAKDGEYARFDYLEFTPVGATAEPGKPPEPEPPEPEPPSKTPSVPKRPPMPEMPPAPNTPPPIVSGAPDGARSPLNTNRNRLPNGANDFAFVSNQEQVAYVSDDTASMIHFQMAQQQPSFRGNVAAPDPELRLLLPDGIEVLGGIRNVDVQPWGYQPTINGTKFTNAWRVIPNGNASKFTLTWKADASKNWSEGQALEGYFWGHSAQGTQTFQPLDIQVVDVPETKSFSTLPVWMSVPSDLTYEWKDSNKASTAEAFSRIGINQMDLWSYLWDGDVSGSTARANQTRYGEKWLVESQKKLANAGIQTVPWNRDKWWREAARVDPTSRSTLTNGKAALLNETSGTDYSLRLTYNEDNDGKGGTFFQEWIEQGKDLIDRGFYLHSFDPEMYRNGDAIGYDPATLEAFESYYAQRTRADYVDPRTMAAQPGKWAEAEDIWAEFKAYRYTKFFLDYRQAMEAHMDSRGIDRTKTPFEMKALTTYHRQWAGLDEFEDYRESPVYTKTLEDPKMLAEVFDYISPMSYPDIYANGKDYDMKRTYKDTLAMDELVQNSSRRTEVTPILSAGYAFQAGFDADVSAEMLKANILEAVIAGAYGFGIWGETKVDALDMKAIAQTVSMLQPYEDILLTGKPSDRAIAKGGNAFVHRLEGKRGSLILVSDYSEQPKSVSVKVEGGPSAKVIDLDNPDIELSQVYRLNGSTEFSTELSNETGRVKMFYVGA